MKTRDTMRKRLQYRHWEGDLLKAYLEDMAMKGWKLESAYPVFCFVKIEPQKTLYTVDFQEKAYMSREIINPRFQERIDKFKEYGWTYIGSDGEFFLIFSSADDREVPDEKNDYDILKNVRKCVMRDWYGPALISAGFFLLALLVGHVLGTIDLYEDNPLLICFGIFVLFGLDQCRNSIRLYLWFFRSKKKIRDGENAEPVSFSELKRFSARTHKTIAIKVAFLVILFAGLIVLKDYRSLTYVFVTLALLLTTTGIVKIFERRREYNATERRAKNRPVRTLIPPFVTLVIINTMFFMIRIPNPAPPPLLAEDFGLSQAQSYSVNVDRTATPVVRRTTVSIHAEDHDGPFLFYSVYDSNCSVVIDRRITGELSSKMSLAVNRPLGYSYRHFRWEKIDKSAWNAQAVYISNVGPYDEQVLVQWDNRILFYGVSAGDDTRETVTDEDIQRILKKLSGE